MKKLLLSLSLAIALLASCTEDETKTEELTVNTSEITDSSVKITFSTIEGAEFYQVSVSKKGETPESAITINADEDKMLIKEDLFAETNYEVKVTAFSANEEKLSEGTADFTTLASESSATTLSYLAGTWELLGTDAVFSATYVFNEDGTGTYTSLEGTDKANERVKEIRWEAVEESNENGIPTGKISISDYSEEKEYTPWTSEFKYFESDKALTIGSSTYQLK